MVSIASVTLLFLRFIYVWLYWVCVAVFRLSLVDVWASHWVASLVVVHGL